MILDVSTNALYALVIAGNLEWDPLGTSEIHLSAYYILTRSEVVGQIVSGAPPAQAWRACPAPPAPPCPAI